MLWKIALFVAAAYALQMLWVYSQQARYVYLPDFPSRSLFATPAAVGLPFEQVWFEAEDGTPLHGWYVPAANAQLTVLFLHGNAGNISHRLDTLQILHELGVNTFIFDYRGFGISEGTPSEDGTYQDARAAWDWLLERGVVAEQIVVHGRSLGGGVAGGLLAQLSGENIRPGGLILESTFTSMAELGEHHYRWLPMRWLTRILYPTRQRLARIDSPLLVVHSPDDRIVPMAHGRALREAAQVPAQWLEIGGAHHNGYLLSRDHYQRGLSKFFAGIQSSL